MINGDQEKKIEKYLPIDRVGEGYGYISPLVGQEFIGIPYGWYADNSTPFIEVREEGKVVTTLNCDDISEIVFNV